jgi:polar amino acid transport system substrate-binding protein
MVGAGAARCHAAGLLIVCTLLFATVLALPGPVAPATAQTSAAPPVSAPSPAPALSARVLINDAPPYRIVGSANGTPYYTGIYVDILRQIAVETGMQLDFVELPYARAFRVMEGGEADIMLGPNHSPERDTYLHYLEPPLPREPKVFLQMRAAAPMGRYEDLRGRRIAVLRGASYFDRFDADAALVKVPVDDYVSALRLAAARRVDAVIMSELQALWLLRQTGFDLVPSGYREPGRDSYIVLARRSPLMAEAAKLSAALRRAVEGGAVRRILQRYE